MQIELSNVSKHFNYSWIFKGLNYTFEAPNIYAITGTNGSGKSSLLQILSGFLSPSKGTLYYKLDGHHLTYENLYEHLTLTTPHLALLEEFTLAEHLAFQSQFKKPLEGHDVTSIMETCGLKKHRDKTLKHFSSGMIQRLRLALAFFFESKVILLDEPTSHLDRNGIEWYKELIKEYQQERLIIISSNVEEEYGFADHVLNIERHKKVKA